MFSLPLVWFNFSENYNVSVFGVETLSSIFKLPLPDSLNESVLLVNSWISEKEQKLIIRYKTSNFLSIERCSNFFTSLFRWHKRTKDNWNEKIYGSNSTEGPGDEFRSGRTLILSGMFKVLFVLVSLSFL